MARLQVLWRSLFGRFSLGVAVVTALAVAALYLLANGIVKSETERQIAAAVDTDIAGLADIYASGGQAELEQRVRDRVSLSDMGRASDYYLLTDGSGNAIAGNLDGWPPLSSENSQAGFITLPTNDEIFARATQLGPNLKLLVGWSTANRDRLLKRLMLAFMIAGTILVLLVVCLGLLSTGRLRQRLFAINRTFRNIGQGQFNAQLPTDGRGDELDELTGHANKMVMRVSNLINAYRDISDNTAHEIRTPLMHLDNRLIRTISEPIPSQQHIGLIQARSDIKKITAMLDSLMDIASSNAKKGDRAGLTEFNLSVIATEIADLYADSAQDLGIDFTVAISPDVMMMGDAGHLQRILSNLLDNAFKYAPNAPNAPNTSKVSLSVEPGPVIQVRDNGPGVPDHMRERIFDRFVRLKTNDATGHGLGLALCKALAERNGLQIRCLAAKPGAILDVRPEKMVSQ